MIDHLFVDIVTKITASRNEGGDFVYGAQTDIPCRFREINDITRGVDGREELDADAMVHLPSDCGVVLGDILIYSGEYYRVDTITKARKMGSTNVEFLKCLLLRHRQVS
jgi:hypothetical protein